VEKLSGLEVGQKLTQMAIMKACQKLAKTGLIDTVDYTYRSIGEVTEEVELELKVVDTLPLLPVTLKIPGTDPEELWRRLAALDIVFGRQMPRTEDAISLYSKAIEIVLKDLGRTDRVNAEVIANASGTPTGIVFQKAIFMGAPPRKKNE
jgi:hypothetical protein